MLKALCPTVVVAALAALSACAQVTTGAETAAQLPRKALEGTADIFEFIFTRPE
jgi:curli biogenesis system outer membrane secretion channel CsgG